MFIVHKSVTSWRIFISDAELSTFTIEQECCLGLIKFWPNTLYRFFRFWIGVCGDDGAAEADADDVDHQ